MSAADQALASAETVPLSMRGPAPTRVVVGYGFWLFLLSDIIIFAALFAAYSVLSHETNGGPTGPELFDKRHVFIETACLPACVQRHMRIRHLGDPAARSISRLCVDGGDVRPWRGVPEP